MSGIKPNEFPTKQVLDGSEEIYTQTSGTNYKFALSDIKSWLNVIEKNIFNTCTGNTAVLGDENTFFAIALFDEFKVECDDVSIVGNSNVSISSQEYISIFATGVTIEAISDMQIRTPEYNSKQNGSVLSLVDYNNGKVEYAKIVEGGADRPLSPYLYQIYYDTNFNLPIIWNGSIWIDFMGSAI